MISIPKSSQGGSAVGAVQACCFAFSRAAVCAVALSVRVAVPVCVGVGVVPGAGAPGTAGVEGVCEPTGPEVELAPEPGIAPRGLGAVLGALPGRELAGISSRAICAI